MKLGSSFSYPKSARLLSRRHYQRMSHHATRHIGQWAIIEFRQQHNHLPRLGITATKRYGNAVKRNRFKRITREAFRLCRHRLCMGIDIVVKPRSAADRATTADLMSELLQFLHA